MALSRQRAAHKASEARDRADARRVRDAAAGLAKTVDPSRLRYLSAATREANYLIDQRTFSWTAFFGHVEKTLPLDARLIAVSPRVEKGEFQIAMVVVARRRSEVTGLHREAPGHRGVLRRRDERAATERRQQHHGDGDRHVSHVAGHSRTEAVARAVQRTGPAGDAMNLWRRVYAERRAVVLPLVVALVANVAVLALGVFPLERSVAGAETAALDAKSDLANARREDMQAKTARTSMERGDVELKKFYAEILPHDFVGAVEILNFLLGDSADDVNLKFQTGQWDREAVRDSSLTKVTGKITLTGDYGSIRQFLFDLETAKEFVVVEKVELTRGQHGQGDQCAGSPVGRRDLLPHGRGRPDGAGGVTGNRPGAGGATEGRRQMKLLPPPGPQRRRQVTLLVVAIAALAVLLVSLRRHRPGCAGDGAWRQGRGRAGARCTRTCCRSPSPSRNSSRSRTSLRTRVTCSGSGSGRRQRRCGRRRPSPRRRRRRHSLKGRRRFRRSRCC